MYFIVILELFLIQRSYSKTCQNITISPDQQFYYSYYSNQLLLEGDDENFQNVQSINMEIVKKSFAIPYHENFIALQIIDPFQMKNKISDKLICQLFKVNEYSINCIESNSIFFDEKDEYKQVIHIQTNNVSQDQCDYMYFDETKQIFILLCHNYPMFKIYEVNIHNQTTLLQQLNLTIQFQEKCKRTQYKLNDQKMIIAYHNCTHWMILQIDQSNKQTQILLDYQYILMNNVLKDFLIVNEIQFCETTSNINLYFIEQNRYAILQIPKIEIDVQQYSIYIASNLIQKLIINSKCSLIIPIIYNQQYSENTTKVENYEFVLHKLYDFNDINYIQNYLFFKRNNELIVDITKQINQTYQIETTPLIFLDQFNLFYQINATNKIIQFYRFSPIKKILRPKKKYIFVIDEEQLLFDNSDNIECKKIDYISKVENLNNIFYIDSIFNCKMKVNCKIQIFLEKSLELFNVEFLMNRTNQLSIGIKRIINYQNTCIIKNHQYKSNYKIYDLSNLDQDHLIYEIDNNLFVYNCQRQRVLLQIVLLSQQVYDYFSNFFIYDQNTNTGRLLFCRTQMIQQYKIKFDHNISLIKKFQQFLLFYSDSFQLIQIINLHNEPQGFNQKKPTYLGYLNLNLSKESQVLFYTKNHHVEIIQYGGLIVFQKFNLTQFYKFPEFPIIYIKTIVNYLYLIFAIHYETNSIFGYIFDQGEIQKIFNWTYPEIKFINPLQYKVFSNYLCILAEKNQFLNILIFLILQDQVILQEIIQTNNSFFNIQQHTIILYDNEQGFILRNLVEYDLEIQIEQMALNKLIIKDHITMKFQPYNLDKQYHFNLSIQIINDCRNLQTYFNKTEINVQNLYNFQLKVSDYFYGPIDKLSYRINSNKLIDISPINQKSHLPECQNLNQTFCLRKIKFVDQFQLIDQFYFTIIVFDKNNIMQMYFRFYNQLAIIWLDYFNFLILQNLEQTLYSFKYQLGDQDTLIYKMKMNFSIEGVNDIKNVKREGNLIEITTNINKFYFNIDNGQFSQITGLNNIVDFIFIENTKEQYLLLHKIKSTFDVVFLISTFRLNEKSIISQINITQPLLQEIKKILDDKFSFKNNSIFHQIKLISCKMVNEMIGLKLLIILRTHSLIMEIQTNKDYINDIHKSSQIRYPFLDINGVQVQADEKILILNFFQNVNRFYYYDLQDDKEFLDYIYSSQILEIKKFNTTHYLLFINDQISIGMFGYNIILDTDLDLSEGLSLVAENQVSTAEITLILKTQIEKFSLTIYVQFITLFLIELYIRMKQKQKQSKR